MHKMIVLIVEHSLLDTLCDELRKERIYFTYWDVKGVGKEVHISQRGTYARLRIEIISREEDVGRVQGIIAAVVPRGFPGAGIISVSSVDEFLDLSDPG